MQGLVLITLSCAVKMLMLVDVQVPGQWQCVAAGVGAGVGGGAGGSGGGAVDAHSGVPGTQAGGHQLHREGGGALHRRARARQALQERDRGQPLARAAHSHCGHARHDGGTTGERAGGRVAPGPGNSQGVCSGHHGATQLGARPRQAARRLPLPRDSPALPAPLC
ncbi:unnamed protein product [Closterium sp. NIES-54]